MQLIVLAIITPLIATIIQLAISRSREYHADATGANFIKNSDGLASALAKLEQGVKTHPMRIGNNATAHMFILNPFRARGVMKLLSTHPPMQTRINKLKSMKF